MHTICGYVRNLRLSILFQLLFRFVSPVLLLTTIDHLQLLRKGCPFTSPVIYIYGGEIRLSFPVHSQYLRRAEPHLSSLPLTSQGPDACPCAPRARSVRGYQRGGGGAVKVFPAKSEQTHIKRGTNADQYHSEPDFSSCAAEYRAFNPPRLGHGMRRSSLTGPPGK